MINKILVALFLFFSLTVYSEPLPKPSCLKDAVDFWQDVYFKHDKDTAIIFERNTFKVLEVVKIDVLNKDVRKMQISNLKKKYSAENVRLQIGVKSLFLDGLDNLEKHKPFIHRELSKEGLPDFLIVLPLIESAYDHDAVSKAGAIGLWQVMPYTARDYGVRKKKLLFDHKINTKVGIQVIKDNYRELNSWPLAITAYNHGLGGVKRGIQKLGTKDICEIIQKHDGSRFGFASKNYYASFLAAKEIYDFKKEMESFNLFSVEYFFDAN